MITNNRNGQEKMENENIFNNLTKDQQMEYLDNLVLKARDPKTAEDAKEELFTRFKPLILSQINRHFKGELKSRYFNELMQEGALSLYTLVNAYDPNQKCKLPAYVKIGLGRKYRKLLTGILNYEEQTQEYDDSYSESYSDEKEILEKEMLEIIGKLDDNRRQIVTDYFFSGKTMKEIAKDLNLSYSYTRQLRDEALRILKEILGIDIDEEKAEKEEEKEN